MNFDTIINRAGTDALKLEFRKKYFGTEEVIPLWVADMDFPVPEAVSQAICERAKHPIFGYTSRGEDFFSAIVAWLKSQHHWTVDANWIEFTPGVVPALMVAVQAFTQPGDRVIVQPPVYAPFFNVVKDHGRVVAENPLINTPDGYQMDFDHLEQLASEPDVKLLLLCSPHNPVGRVWTREELEKLGEICSRNHVIVISDEIHADLTLDGVVHTPLAALSDEMARNTITCMAPSKTFNIAGLSTSYIVASNEALMAQMQKQIQAFHLFMGNMFGAVAMKAAYQSGAPWLDQLKSYIGENVNLVMDFIQEKMPEVKVHRPEATYLMWLDFSAWGLSAPELKHFIIKEARLGLNDGLMFGPQGRGFQRLNVASAKSVIQQALDQLLTARNALK